jgi:hypothetical protein
LSKPVSKNQTMSFWADDARISQRLPSNTQRARGANSLMAGYGTFLPFSRCSSFVRCRV